METMELGMECVNRNMDAYQLLRERHDEVVRLRAILGSFKENLESYLDMTKREYDSYSQDSAGRPWKSKVLSVRALEALSKLGSIRHLRDCLNRLEASTR